MEERIFRESPFAWSAKDVTRIIRKKYKGREQTTRLAVYWAICEMDSDFRNGPIKTGVVKAISGYSGVYEETVRSVITEFEKLGLCKRNYIMGEGGRYSGMTLSLCSPLGVYTRNGVDGGTIKKIDSFKKLDSFKKKDYRYQRLKITEEEFNQLKEMFSLKDVKGECEKAEDWLLSKGRVYKNYPAFMRNWLRKTPDTKSRPKIWTPPVPINQEGVSKLKKLKKDSGIYERFGSSNRK